jgi:hypothetical protein
MRTIGRLIVVPLAFLIAAAAAGFVLFTLGLEKITHALHGTEVGAQTVEYAFDMGTLILSGLTIIPSLAVIILGEVARIRSWLYYMIGGGFALAALPLLGRLNDASLGAMPDAAVWQVLATAGFVGGLVYWLIAGRNA